MAQHICNSPGFPCVEIDQGLLDKHIANIVGGAVRIIDLGSRSPYRHFELYCERFGSSEGIGHYAHGVFHMENRDEVVAAIRAIAN